MIRKTLTICSLIGLLLSVVMWGVSYWNFWYSWDFNSIEVNEGAISFEYFHNMTMADDIIWGWTGFNTLSTKWRPRFEYDDSHDGSWEVIVPFWPTVLFCSALLWFLPLRRRKRKKLGLCLKCGYDLRASKDRCPECGEEFVSTSVASRG